MSPVSAALALSVLPEINAAALAVMVVSLVMPSALPAHPFER
jgi:hypothetical protein